jgi:hypothetical protein
MAPPSEQSQPRPTKAQIGEFSLALAPLMSICRPELSDEQFHGYLAALADIPPAILFAAAESLSKTRKYPSMPMPGEIREVAASLLNRDAPAAGEAFRLCLSAVEKFGHRNGTKGLASLPKLVAAALERFGWVRLCFMVDDELGTAFAQFRECYEPLVTREQRKKVLSPATWAALAQIGAEEEDPAIEYNGHEASIVNNQLAQILSTHQAKAAS